MAEQVLHTGSCEEDTTHRERGEGEERRRGY
jgi:hypothetical protein